MKLFTDYHTHPQGHRLQPYTLELLQPWADAARAHGITDVAFTDHDRYHTGVDFDVINALREKNPGIQFRAGIELDNDPVTSQAGYLWVQKNWDRLDFVLGSVHYLEDKTEMFDSAGQESQFDDKSVDTVYADYIRQMEKLIVRGNIDCLSHLDLVKIHGHRSQTNAAKLFAPVLELAHDKRLGMEINTAGWRKPVAEAYPHRDIITLAHKMDIPITLSSDAHSHMQLGKDYDRLTALLKQLNISRVAVYHRHEPQWVNL
jgi:histidinol-phosphatase (PHP family)